METADALAAGFLAVCAAGAVLVKAAGGPTRAAVALAGVGVLGALVRLALIPLRERARSREEWLELLVREPVSVSRIDDEVVYALGVEQEADEALRLLDVAQRHAPYAVRDVDELLRAALQQALGQDQVTLIVVTGRSKTGKSRSALEAVRRLPRTTWLIVPQAQPSLLPKIAAASPKGIDGPVVVWLDDLELWARPADQGLSPHTLSAFAAWNRPVVVLGTAFGKGVDLAGSDGSRFQEVFYDLLARARTFPLESRATVGELERMSSRFGAVVSERLTREGLGEFMIAAPRLIQRLQHDRTSPEGQAIVRAAIDCRRAGILGPISIEWLRELCAVYLLGVPTDDSFSRGLAWATEPLYATTALLARSPGDGEEAYEPYDFVVDHAARQGDPIDQTVWDRVVDRAPVGDLWAVSNLAYSAGDLTRAARALRRADEAGGAWAAFNLGVVLKESGEYDEAEAAYRRAGERGHGRAAVNLGVLLQERGDEAGAEAAFRHADELGDPAGASNIGALLAERGQHEEADAAFRRGDEAGSATAAYNLGVLLRERGELEAAEAALRRADERGDAEGAFNLGVMLFERGALKEAEAAYRRASERGVSYAAVNLGLLLRDRGDVVGAEAAFRQADELGDPGGAGNLGALLAERGDLDGAEDALRRGDAGGDAGAAFNLGVMLRDRGELAGAEAALRRADERGELAAAGDLGVLLAERGAVEEAEAVFRRGDAQGDATAAFNLGTFLWRCGELKEAEAAFRRAHDRGAPDAQARLAAVLQDRADLARGSDLETDAS